VNWTTAALAVTTAFLSSLVEAVEALTIVLAVASVRGRRPAGTGAFAGLVLLALLVLALGPLLDRISLHLLQLVIGVLLPLFGMRWLRKAVLRAAVVIPLHDEAIAFATETEELRDQARRHEARLDWLAGLASFKAVVLEGLEVVFIVIAVGAGRGLLGAASIGALAACLVIVAVGLFVHRPLARVPENTLKFAVGVMLSAFGIFWTGEGLGVPWPGEDLAILAFAALFLMIAPIDCTGSQLPDLTDMRPQDFPPRLLRQPLRDSHNGHEDEGRYEARDDEYIASELASRCRRLTLRACKRAHWLT
jgi:uncharacterized membrane protein